MEVGGEGTGDKGKQRTIKNIKKTLCSPRTQKNKMGTNNGVFIDKKQKIK